MSAPAVEHPDFSDEEGWPIIRGRNGRIHFHSITGYAYVGRLRAPG